MGDGENEDDLKYPFWARSPGLQARARASKPCLPGQGGRAPRPVRLGQSLRSMGYGPPRTDGQNIPCILQDIIPLGPLPCLQSESGTKIKAGQGYC